MIGKTREIRPPDEFIEGWKVPRICKSLGHSGQ
jgi:hypothetical protein